MFGKNKEITLYKETSYNYSFIGENNLKEIYNEWDLFIDWSENIGNSHYAFTINYPSDKIHKRMFLTNTFRNILALHPLEKNEKFKLDGVLYNGFDTLESDFTTEWSWWDDIHYKLEPTREDLLTTWIFTIVEENKEGYVHLHGVIAIKNIIDYNKNIKGNLLSMFKENWSFSDIVIKNLDNFKDIKGWVKYLHQNNRWVFKPVFYITLNYFDVIEKRFLSAYKDNYNLKNTKKEVFNGKFRLDNLFFDIIPFGGLHTNLDKKIYDFIGIKLNKNEVVQELFLDLVINYTVLNNLFINKNSIYKKLKDPFISYELIGTIEHILFDNFQNIIVPFFVGKFPIHFNNFDFYFLIKNFKNKMKSDILKIKNIMDNNRKLDFNLMEFKDIKYNRFKEKDKSEKLYKSLTSNTKYKFGYYRFKKVVEKTKKEDIIDFNKLRYNNFTMKYANHWNFRFQFWNHNKRNIIYEDTEKCADLTATTKDHNKINYFLGKTSDGRIQYMSKDHTSFIDWRNIGRDSFFNTKEFGKKSDKKIELEHIVSNNPDNVKKIEFDLTNKYPQHNSSFLDITQQNLDIYDPGFNGKLQNCLEMKSKSIECLQIFNIRWGCNAELLVNIMFF